VIAYLTHDEVNAADALRTARELGLDLIAIPVKDADQGVAADVLLLDLDHLPPECRTKLFREAAVGGLREGVAVHSYRLTAAERHALRTAGVGVARRLVADLLTPSPADPMRVRRECVSASDSLSV
jgi:hypothetical protein